MPMKEIQLTLMIYYIRVLTISPLACMKYFGTFSYPSGVRLNISSLERPFLIRISSTPAIDHLLLYSKLKL